MSKGRVIIFIVAIGFTIYGAIALSESIPKLMEAQKQVTIAEEELKESQQEVHEAERRLAESYSK